MISAKLVCKKILSYLNCEFFFTGIAVLKVFTIILAIISTTLLFISYDRATWFKRTPNPKTGKSDADKCVEIYLRASPAVREAIQPCPMEFLVLAPKYTVVSCLGISVFWYFLLLLVDLGKYPIFRRIDQVYHMGAGFLMVLFSLFVAVYLLLVFNRVTCADDGVTNVKQCKEKIWEKQFQVWMYIAAGIFTLYTGFTYCVAGPMIIRQERTMKKASSTELLNPSKHTVTEMGDSQGVVIAVEDS